MNSQSISPRIVEHFVGLLALAFLAAGLFTYALQEPQRIVTAQAAQLTADLDESMTIYAQNCAVCHGLAGEGIGSTPALNRPEMQSTDPASLEKMISRGLYNTSMPAWNLEDGGPLSDYQIGLLVTLIQRGDWQTVQDRVVNLGLAPLVPFSAQPDPALIELTSTLPDGETLVQGIETYANECVACHGPDGLGTSLAPALNTADLRLKDTSTVERTILNGVPGTLMAPWQDALSMEQVASLLALITRWDEVPNGAIPAPDRSLPVTEQSLQLGADLYAQSCSRCHGLEGQGTPRAPSLNVKGYLEQTNDLAMQKIITSGIPGTSMPAWGDRLTDAEIQAIVGFIRSWEPTAPQVAVPARGGGAWWSTEGGTRPGGGPPWMPSGGLQPGRGGNGQ